MHVARQFLKMPLALQRLFKDRLEGLCLALQSLESNNGNRKLKSLMQVCRELGKSTEPSRQHETFNDNGPSVKETGMSKATYGRRINK